MCKRGFGDEDKISPAGRLNKLSSYSGGRSGDKEMHACCSEHVSELGRKTKGL